MDDQQNILSELKDISPLLHDLKVQQQPTFKVPEDYFSTLKEEVFSIIEIGMNDDIGKHPFKVPDNYFSDLSGRVMVGIDEEESLETEGKIIRLQSKRNHGRTTYRKWFSMAAAAAVVVLIMVNLAKVDSDATSAKVEISQQDALQYIEDNYSDFESEELYSLAAAINDELSLSVSDDFENQLENYMDNNLEDWDISLFTNEI
ncbi:MAG: hypothetical protein R2730_08040 [Chitinophagales bacterium]